MAAEFLGYSGGEAAEPPVRYVKFTQDLASLTVVTKSGYTLYSLKSVNALQKIFTSDDNEELLLAERLYSSSLLAVVTSANPYKLRLCHFKKGNDICTYSYHSNIRSLKLNRERLVVCVEDGLYIHNMRDMKVLHIIRDTPLNPTGLFALSACTDSKLASYVAYPGSSTLGEVHLFEATSLKAYRTILAHNNPLMGLAFNSLATLLSTASQKGTVIRIFSVEKGEKLFEFRRGVKRCADIYCLSFSLDSTYLCCSSNTETVHVFKLESTNDRTPVEENQGWYGYLGQALKSSTSYLPSSVSDVFTQGRDFALARLPTCGVRNVCAVTCIEKQMRVLVATQDGILYVYDLDVTLGGECTLLSQHRLYDDEITKGNGTEITTISYPTTTVCSPRASANGSPPKLSSSKEAHKPVNNDQLANGFIASNKNQVQDTTENNLIENGNAGYSLVENRKASKKNKKSCRNSEEMKENGSTAGSDDWNGSKISDVKGDSNGSADSCLEWTSQRKSYARVVQSVGAAQDGAEAEVIEEPCTAQQDLAEAAMFEDALCGDAYSANDSSLRIDDSSEFPAFNSLKRS